MTPNIERVVLITGASSGIGAAVARKLAEPGVALLLHARGGVDGAKKALLEDHAEAARAAGAKVETCFADLTHSRAAAGLVETTLERFGRLDQIISNAGFADRRVFGDLTVADMDRAYQGMPRAFFELVTAALEPLSKSSWGRVVAISSFVAHVYNANGLFPVTAAAKAAIESLAKSLAAMLAPHGTTVNCVAPGYTKKESAGHSALSQDGWKTAAERTPLGRIADPQDIAAMIAFLLTREARHITGQVIHVDGGLTLG
jgi:3-oxoacyl-[acyl-carrier protein] reductase